MYKLLGLEIPLLHFLFLPCCHQNLARDMTVHYPPAFHLSYMAIIHASSTCAIFLLFFPRYCTSNANQTFQDINTWFKVNLLTLNLNKTQYLEFRTKNYYNVNTQIKYDQECITSASEIKFLGLTIDDILSWKQHIEQVLNKMCTACYALRNIKHIVPIDTLRVIYFAHIHYYKLWYNFLG